MDNLQAKTIWEQVIKILESNLSKLMIDTWFKPTFPLNLTETTLEIGAPKQTIKEWLESRYLPDILSALHSVVNKPLNVVFTFVENTNDTSPENISITKNNFDALDILQARIVWKKVLKNLENSLSKLMIDTWLRPTFPLRLTETTLEIGTDKETAKEWITTRYLHVIELAVYSVTNKSLNVIFTYSEERPIDTDTSSEKSIDVVDKLQATKVWGKALKRIELELSKSEFDTLLRRTFPLNLTETTLEIGTPIYAIKHILESKYLTIITSAVYCVTNKSLDVVFNCIEDSDIDNSRENTAKKRISVSCKRQITIPIEFYKLLEISTEVDCYAQDGALIIKPVRPEYTGEFVEGLLEDLISQGLSGEELLSKFREMNQMIRPAIEASNNHIDAVALITDKQENPVTEK